MRIRKLIPFALSCLLVLETPLVSQAAEILPVSDTSVQAETLTWADTSDQNKAAADPATDSNITATANSVSASRKVTVEKPKLTLASSKTAYLNNPITLKATAAPEGKITWKSSKPEIAVVSSNGKVTPKKTGRTNITASCNGLKKTCKVTVKKPSVKLNTKKITIFAENDYTLTPSAHPSSGLSYHSSKPKIAKVSKDGTITGVRPGTVTITASVPGAKASCEVTVLKNDYKLNRSSKTLMRGGNATFYMSNISSYNYVSYELSDWSVAELHTSGNICKVTARQAGKTTLNAYCHIYKDGQYVTCKRSCTIKVIDSGIVQHETAIAAGTDKLLRLKHVEKSGAKITDTSWESSNPEIAYIDRKTGKVKGKKFGLAKITATVSYSDGTAKKYASHIKVSTPKTTHKYTVLSVGNSRKIALSGLTTYSDTTWKLKKTSLASIGPDGTVTAGRSPGKTTVTIKSDGKKITHTIIVTNPSLKSSYVTLAPMGTAKIPLSGLSAQSKVTYNSLKKSVATVSNSGVVTAHRYGTAKIAIRADGNSFTFEVDVAPQRAIDACKTGYSIMYSSTYSQAQRMSTGFYDCSSLAFRSYGCDTKLLGGIPTWAPTAADMASYLERTGKAISYWGVNSSKLLPGDLIFYGGAPNGRYKNIYHVSMYYGGGYRLEKPLRDYYPESNIVMIARPIK